MNSEFIYPQPEDTSPVKKFFVQLAKGLAYFALFCVVQLLTTVIFIFAHVAALYANTAAGGGVDIGAVSQEIISQSSLITVVSGSVTLIVLLLIFSVRKKSLFNEAYIQKIRPAAIVPVILFGTGLNLLTSLVMGAAPISEDVMQEYVQSSSVLTEGSPFVMIVSSCIIAPLTEEIVFRGLILTRFRRGMPTVPAVVLSSLLFGLLHGQIVWICYAFILGIILSVVFVRFNSLLANILLHAAYNATSVALLQLAPNDFETVFAVLAVTLSVTMGALLIFLTGKKSSQKKPD